MSTNEREKSKRYSKEVLRRKLFLVRQNSLSIQRDCTPEQSSLTSQPPRQSSLPSPHLPYFHFSLSLVFISGFLPHSSPH